MKVIIVSDTICPQSCGARQLIRVTSLKTTIILQFAVILVPIIALLAYQTISEAQRAREVKVRVQLHERAVKLRDQYSRFINGVVDSVDTQRLSLAALNSLREAAREMGSLGIDVDSKSLLDLSAELVQMAHALAADPSLKRLEAFRGRVAEGRALVSKTRDDFSYDLDTTIRKSIGESQRNRNIVAVAALVLLALTLWFIYKMIKGLTQPLAIAVSAADSIAEGRPVSIDLGAQRDIGNLLVSLQRMHRSLQTYQRKNDEHQKGLEQNIKQLAESRASLSEAQRMASLGNWALEVESATAHWSDEMRRILGVSQGSKQPTLRRFLASIDPKEHKSVIAELRALLASPRNFSGEHRVVGGDQSGQIVFHQGASEADSQGRVFRLHGTIQDITERKHVEQQIRRLALYDSLTGLPNRQFFKESLGHDIARAQRGKENLAVLFIDLDRFKRINDTLGHAVGDALLQEIARRLLGCVRRSDLVGRNEDLPLGIVARQGGDEFTASLIDLRSPQDAAKVAERMLRDLEQPLYIEGQELNVTASIGIAIFPENGQDAETLLKNSDIALYQAKAAGRNIYKFFNQEMNAAALEKLKLEDELKHAIGRNEFVLYYQPKVDIESGRIVGVEALIRWRHPQRGIVLPGLFIGIAEEAGMIVPIGQWVLQTACQQLAAWRQANLPQISVAVNLASPSFRSVDLAREVSAVLDSYQLRPDLLELEVTESMLMENVDVTLRTLRQLRELGVKLAIDDFGTGHSSLSYLRRFRVDQLKIDRSFVAEITKSASDAAITTIIILLGRELNLEVVAEGVETAEQARLLREQGCRLLQGYFFGRPVPADELARRLQTKLTMPD